MLCGNSAHNSPVILLVSFIFINMATITICSSMGDMLFIRHGRSRVRHSNEKDHIRWGLQVFDNLTLDYEMYDNDTALSGSGNGGSQLFGSDLWMNYDNNGNYSNQITQILKQYSTSQAETETKFAQAVTTAAPSKETTQLLKKRKLHKKKIMEDIRKTVNKGLQYLKIHNLSKYDEITFDDDLQYKTNDGLGRLSDTPRSDERFLETEILNNFYNKNSFSTDNRSAKPFTNTTETNIKVVIDGKESDVNTKITLVTPEINSTQLNESFIDDNNDARKNNNIKNLRLVSHSQYSNVSAKGFKHGIVEEDNAEVNFEEINLDNDSDSENNFIIESFNSENSVNNLSFDDQTKGSEANKFLEGVVDEVSEDELDDWDEISRNNRRNLMRGRDVVTKFLQIVETQHSLGSNCEAGTSLNLGEGVVDRYAQDRFRIEAEVAVNRANMLTRIFKTTELSVQSSVNLLHASVLSMVEFDDDIFAAGNCFDWNQHPSHLGLFCPFAYRLPPPNHGALIAKDLATEYHYLGNTSEWFFLARKNAEKVIARNDQYIKAFHLYSNRSNGRKEEDTLFVRYEDGRWSKPYYDCGGGNIWMLTYTVPFFGYENGTYLFKGTSGIDIDLRRVDIDQCPQRNIPESIQPLNIFAGTDKCKQRTTMCEAIKGLGFRRGSYKCICRKGFYYPDTSSSQKYFNGSILEEEYEKLMLGKNSSYNKLKAYECLRCAEGCDSCEDASPCIAALNWPMRTSILVLACTVIGLLPPAAWFTFRYQQVKVVRAASPALLRVIALGAFLIYCTTIVMYPNPSLYTCTAKIWLREIGFSLTYGALMLKTWRISVIFRVRSAKAVKITDAALLKRLGIICGVIGTFLLVRTLVSPPDVVVGKTADDLKAFLCKTNWWDYTFTSMEVLFLAWGVRLCIMVRKAPSEFNESRFISMAIYNEFLLTCFLNVSMIFLQSPANPDLLYIIFFCHTQLTVTLLLGLIFGSKVYIVLRSGKSHQESINMGAKSSGAKFNFRPQIRTFANPSSATTSTAQLETKLSDQEALEEVRLLSVQLRRIQEMAPPKGVAVMTISSILDSLKATSSEPTQTTTSKVQQPTTASYLSTYSTSHDYETNVQLTNIENRTEMGRKDFEIEFESNSTNDNFVKTSTAEEHFLENGSQCQQSDNYPPNILSCLQLGSPLPEGSITFANIKLDCMCSHSDDLDRICHHEDWRENLQHEKSYIDILARNKSNIEEHLLVSKDNSKSGNRAADETSCGGARQNNDLSHFNSIPVKYDKYATRENVSICDICKNKLNGSLKKMCSSSDVRSNTEILYTSGIEKLSVILGNMNNTKAMDSGFDTVNNADDLKLKQIKLHSSDDMTFCTTDEESDINYSNNLDQIYLQEPIGGPSISSSGSTIPRKYNIMNKQTTNNGSQSDGSSNSNSNKETKQAPPVTRRSDKLLLNLNDRSKYTREVSV